MTAFHETALGQRFLEYTVPSAVRELGRLADQVGELTAVLRGRVHEGGDDRRKGETAVVAASATPAATTRVLIVDDDPLCRSGLARALKTLCQVTHAGSAEEALEVLTSTAVDIVLTDFNMPGHDGLWLLEQVRSRRTDVRRVLMSGQDIHNAPELIDASVLHAFITKPATREALLTALGLEES
jgi:CheY-like chemotaxis protein